MPAYFSVKNWEVKIIRNIGADISDILPYSVCKLNDQKIKMNGLYCHNRMIDVY